MHWKERGGMMTIYIKGKDYFCDICEARTDQGYTCSMIQLAKLNDEVE